MDLFDNDPADTLSVSDLNALVAAVIGEEVGTVRVQGEISNFTRASSGHWYFSLKDDRAQVSCAMFKNRNMKVRFNPKSGDSVTVVADAGLYQARGDFQLVCTQMMPAGQGALYEKFLRLKAKLEALGFFDEDRKRDIPAFTETVGIVTSQKAAALHDVLSVFARRAPHVKLIVYPASVQGATSASELTAAVRKASERNECGVLIVCRGGGSMEDLFSFNDEELVRAIADAPMPVISGVGHETDFTLCDFVADRRAPTPTAAAELASAPTQELREDIERYRERLAGGFGRFADNLGQKIDFLQRNLIDPNAYLRFREISLNAMVARLKASRPDIRQAAARTENLSLRHKNAFSSLTDALKARLDVASARLGPLSPQNTIKRGYAVLTDSRGNILKDPAQIKAGMTVRAELAKGTSEITVAEATVIPQNSR